MKDDPDLRRLIARIKVAARRAKRPLRELSVAVHYSPNYLSQLFGGSARLSFKVVLEVAAELELHPARLFGDLYAFSDLLPAESSGAGLGLAPRPDHQGEVQRLLDRLYLKVAESGMSQREICRRLGEHEDLVNQVLNGRIELRVEHVLGILRVVGIDPASFFAEFYGAYGRLARLAQLGEELLPGVTRAELYTFFQDKIREVRAAPESACTAVEPRRERPDRLHPLPTPANERSGAAPPLPRTPRRGPQGKRR